jgi:hypothetical protein
LRAWREEFKRYALAAISPQLLAYLIGFITLVQLNYAMGLGRRK